MIEWQPISARPMSNQRCWLTNGEQIIGPLPWKEDGKGNGGWLDFIEGTLYTGKEGVTHWTASENIILPASAD